MSKKVTNQDRNVIKVDPVTLLAIVVVLLFIPLVLAGFLSQ
ncbi:hypothetical protein [Egbenema bharatensis]